MLQQGDFIMEKGEWNTELLIMSKGSARDDYSRVYGVGEFWGVMGAIPAAVHVHVCILSAS